MPAAMRPIALVLALGLAVGAFALAAPAATACPDPDNPCDPTPYDPLPACPGGPKDWIGCVKERLP